jgi:hypothetical protein
MIGSNQEKQTMLLDLADMQTNMALMEAHGREEEFVTSALNLDKDE